GRGTKVEIDSAGENGGLQRRTAQLTDRCSGRRSRAHDQSTSEGELAGDAKPKSGIIPSIRGGAGGNGRIADSHGARDIGRDVRSRVEKTVQDGRRTVIGIGAVEDDRSLVVIILV